MITFSFISFQTVYLGYNFHLQCFATDLQFNMKNVVNTGILNKMEKSV